MNKKLLYYFWGYLSDKVDKDGNNISSPDGNFSYSIWLIQEFQKRGWEVYCVHDRDKEIVEHYGRDAFKSFSTDKRFNAYNKINFVYDDLPNDVDLVINEWRFSTKDNNKQPWNEGYSPDLEYQKALLKKYNGNVPYAIMDLDYKLEDWQIKDINPTMIIDQGMFPKNIGNVSLNCPVDIEELRQFPMTQIDQKKLMVYVGNDYNRRDDFDNKFMPMAKHFPGKIHLVGNWLKDSLADYRKMHSNVVFHGRIGANDFYDTVHDSGCVPLLATPEYKEHGFMTMRIMETLLFGSIPIGFTDFILIEDYLPYELIATNAKDLKVKIEWILKLSPEEREMLRNKVIAKCGHKFDARNFVSKILEKLNESRF